MRLLNVRSFEFKVFYSAAPKYAIASHRWVGGSEATIKDIRKRRNTETIGYRKVVSYAEFIKKHIPDIEWLWIDTCCINQESSEEVTEAINSMLKWYRSAEICIAYLPDATAAEDLSSFRQSQWFSRGWTLQELLVPQTVIFLTQDWQIIGHKGGIGHSNGVIHPLPGPSLVTVISLITGISEGVLHDYKYSKAVSVEKKLEWMVDRETTREEDQSYCLLGLFGVHMSIIYGEGQEQARKRLLAEIAKFGPLPLDLGIEKVPDETARTLHQAAEAGDLELISQFLRATPSAWEHLWRWDAGGSLPLHHAVEHGHALACRLLMSSMNKRTWDPTDLLDVSGKTPFVYALSNTGSEDVVREFLTDEGLCFSIPIIPALRRAAITRLLEIGGVNALQRAVFTMRKVLSPSRFCNALHRFLPVALTLSESDELIPYSLTELSQIHDVQLAPLSQSLAKIADDVYKWVTSSRAKRLVLLHKAVGLNFFTGSDGLNFVGKAIVASDLATLVAIHAVDYSLFSKSIGTWTEDKRTHQATFGPWRPLRFAALLGNPDTVKQVAQFSEPEDDKPPRLRAVHWAAVMARRQPNPGSVDTWSFLRSFTAAEDAPADAAFCTVDLLVEVDSEWGALLFPHGHEATVEHVKSDPGTTVWNGGFVWTADGRKSSSVTFIMRVRMLFVETGYPENQENLVQVDFMHSWGDAKKVDGHGRVAITLLPQDDAGSIIWFRAMGQHAFTRLQGGTKLESGTDWKESHYNLRSWQLQCVREQPSSSGTD